MRLADHLMIAPVVLPLFTGAVMLALGGERSRNVNAALNVASTFALVAISIVLLRAADAAPSGVAGVYRLGDWPAPFGIVLVVDRLATLMLLLTSLLAAAAVLFSLARWHRVGVLFHPLFQFLLMGINGAFLTGDLFNLFVFFEVLLAASYGLALHGSGSPRVMAGLHYIVVNLAASLLFLIGVSLIYGISGTLNMADLAGRIPAIRAENRALLEAGAGILGIAFLVKAGMWPLCFWLPGTYAAAPPPVASIFAILTKVGVYIVLRLWLLLFGDDAGASAQFGGEWLLVGGMATVAFGTIGCLASQDMARLAAFSVLVSSGTVLASIGIGRVGVTGGALFYLISSTLGLGAFFLLTELVERGREPGADVLAVTREVYGEEHELEEAEEMGIAIPVPMGILGLAFIGCALVISGLPPLSGFIAKFAILTAALNPPTGAVSNASWVLLLVLILSGLATLIAMTRAGIRTFWAAPDRRVPHVRLIEMAPVAVLLLCNPDDQSGPGHALHASHGAVGARSSGLYPRCPRSCSRAAERPDGENMIRIVPFPITSASLLVLWLLLNQTLSPGHILLGGAVALIGGWALSALEVPKARPRRLAALFHLAALVFADIVRSNIAVASIILGLQRRRWTSGFVEIPLELRDPYGLAMLACIITSTPGTLWVDFNQTSGTLTIHVLDLVDKTGWVRTIKGRYERLLLEIFT
jgi:multicomponent K+:H+ antiporter subunit D